MIEITLIFNLFFCFLISRNTLLFSPLSVFAWFTCFSYFLYFLLLNISDLNTRLFSAMPVSGINSAYYEVVITYSLIIFFAFLFSLNIKKNSYVNRLSYLQEQINTTNINNSYIRVILIVVIILTSIHFISLDKSILIYNTKYLMLGKPDVLNLPENFARIIHFLLKPISILSFTLFIYFSIFKYNLFYRLIFLLLSIYPLLIMLVQNSRWLPLIFGLGFIVSQFSSSKKRKIYQFFLIILVFFSYLKVLLGRGTSYQDLGTTFKIFYLIDFNNLISYFFGLYLNACQGVVNFANTILISPNYNINYILSSFSPLISSLDNFVFYRELYEVRITRHVPISAFSEAYHFGNIYFAIYLFITLYWLRKTTIFYLKNSTLMSLVMLNLSYWLIFIQSQYSVRTSFRFIIISTIISIILTNKTKEFNDADSSNS